MELKVSERAHAAVLQGEPVTVTFADGSIVKVGAVKFDMDQRDGEEFTWVDVRLTLAWGERWEKEA